MRVYLLYLSEYIRIQDYIIAKTLINLTYAFLYIAKDFFFSFFYYISYFIILFIKFSYNINSFFLIY